jgi:hypothetical protein
MAVIEFEKIQRDHLALSVARALAIANDTAAVKGIALDRSLVTITEEAASPHRLWQIHYGPRDFVHRRGGDLTVVVDDETGEVRSALRGQ